MLSLKSKLLFKISGEHIIEHVCRAVASINSKNIVCVLGNSPQQLKDFIKQNEIQSVDQKNPCGTANAVKIAISSMPVNKINKILILCGDVPFISPVTLKRMVSKLDNSDLCLGTYIQENPAGYGRIIRDNKRIIEIIEEKDASSKIKKVNEINTGIICINEGVLRKFIGKIKNNNKQKEYYLTDIIKLLSDNNYKISSYTIKNGLETMGINSKRFSRLRT